MCATEGHLTYDFLAGFLETTFLDTVFLPGFVGVMATVFLAGFVGVMAPSVTAHSLQMP